MYYFSQYVTNAEYFISSRLNVSKLRIMVQIILSI